MVTSTVVARGLLWLPSAFVMKDDGELEMRMVQVGLQDYVNAEIRFGLQLGETVTLGQTDTR